MEKLVRGIRETYFDDIIADYREEGEKSFLYRTFWAESVRELLKKSLPPLPKKNEIRKQMEEMNKGFLRPLADEENGQEQMEEHFARLSEEVKELLEIHLPQLPESVLELLKEHSGQLPKEVKERLTGCFPWLLKEEALWPEYGSKIRELLKKNVQNRPEWKCKVLKRKPPQRAGRAQEKQKKERRDFWEELMLNDAGYEAGEIKDTEYYLWLTEYLAARDIYYKDISIRDGHKWLYRLLRKGLGRKLEESVKLEEIRKLEKEIEELEKEITEMKNSQEREGSGNPETFKELEKSRKRKESRKLEKISELEMLQGLKESGEPERLRKDGENIRDKAGVGRDLADLAEKLRHEAETGGTEISSRLHDLKRRAKTRKGEVRTEDYLPWLTRQLEKMAIHIKIKTWLQDNGYPIVDDDKAKKHDEAKRLWQECRKQDFSMRLFGAYCDSEKGYDFIPKEEGGGEADEGWTVRNGFCVWKPDGFKDSLQALLQALEQEGRENFYLPLAMDLHSGCVFFLAGKGYYAEVYEKCEDKKLQDDYEKENTLYCYDYLRLDRREDSGDTEVAFRLEPTFHKNAGKDAGKDYDKALREFKLYCEGVRDKQMEAQDIDGGEGYFREDVNDIPRRKIKAFNEEGFSGIPKALWWAFDGQEDSEPSRVAKKVFEQTKRKIAKDRLLPR